jgi:hypothetical protein
MATVTAIPAAEIQQFTLARDGNRFTVEFVADLDVAQQPVYRLISDYRQFPVLSPAIVSSAVAPGIGGTTILDLRVRLCLWLACWHRDKVSAVRAEEEPTRIELEAVAGVGDFRHWDETIELADDGAGTRLRYRAEIEPRFRIPALVGTWLFRRALRRDLQRTVDRIELLASDG